MLLPWGRRHEGVGSLLERTIEEIDSLGPITLLDFTIQGLPLWQKASYLQEVVLFTFRQDDLVGDGQSVPGRIDIQVIDSGVLKLVKIQSARTSQTQKYDYAGLLRRSIEVIGEHSKYVLAGMYFDHRLDASQAQSPFVVLTLIREPES